jgi:5-methylcytosine-specific restriction endonuclease McrA
MATKICPSCNVEKDVTDFNFRYKALGIRHNICIVCQRKYKRKWYHGSAKEKHLENVKERNKRVREEAKEFVYQYLLTHPCETCGESDVRVLEFHHTDQKKMGISVMAARGAPIHKLEKEIANCQVLCANCHRKLTVEERGWFRGRK